MITDLRKSINSILYQRVYSPLFGTFIVSWLSWNWKIVYITFFISENKIDINKIDYIVSNFNDLVFLLWRPLASTLLLLTVIPFASNGSYLLNIKFKQWRVNQKNIIERKRLLTIEQSIQLREQISESEKKFELLLKDKDDQIKQLEILIEKLKENNENQRTEQAKVNSEKSTGIKQLKSQIGKLEQDNKSLKTEQVNFNSKKSTEIKQLKSQIGKLEQDNKSLKTERAKVNTYNYAEDKEIITIFNRINNDFNLKGAFRIVISSIRSNRELPNDNIKSNDLLYFEKNNVIEQSPFTTRNRPRIYRLTTRGYQLDKMFAGIY